MRRAAALLCSALFSLTTIASAEALTLKDIIELTKAGLGDEVLLALIEVNRGVYPIDPASLMKLKEAGVSDPVIAALVLSGRETLAEPVPATTYDEPREASASPPQVVVVEQAPAVQQVMVPVPVYVPVASTTRRGRVSHAAAGTVSTSTFIPFQSGPPVDRPVVETPKKPVYWGFGGKLRPDAWEPAGHRRERGDGK